MPRLALQGFPGTFAGDAVDGTGVTICVIDTGINPDHEQFDSKALGSTEFFDAVNGFSLPYDD
ncbi:MAG: hypothetical protein IIA40_10965, partial [SAR324 cluster bacterium]|nr:hypothetical protein [SAR324 cluster bacterium]